MAKRRRKIKVPSLENPDYDVGTAELHKKEIVEVYGQDKKRHARVLSSPMNYYFARGFIDRDQHRAGSQFYKLWYGGGGRPRLAMMNLERVDGSSDTDFPSEMRQRYRAALESFTRPIHRKLVFDVVCVGEYADAAMRAAMREAIEGASDPRNKGLRTLRSGLDDLVTHFTRKRPNEFLDNGRNER